MSDEIKLKRERLDDLKLRLALGAIESGIRALKEMFVEYPVIGENNADHTSSGPNAN